MLTLKGELHWNLDSVNNKKTSIIYNEDGIKSSSATPGGGWVFGFQAFFETAKQNPVALVLLVFPGMELPLDLEAPMDHEGRTQHGEPVSGHVEFAGLQGGRDGRDENEERRGC